MAAEDLAIVSNAPVNTQRQGNPDEPDSRQTRIDALAEAVADKVTARLAASPTPGSAEYETPAVFGRRYNRSAKWVRARAAELSAIRDGTGTGSRYLIPVAAGDAAMQRLLVAEAADPTAGLKTADTNTRARARVKRAKSRNGNELLPVRRPLPLH